MHERGEHCATDHDLEAEKSGRAKLHTPQVHQGCPIGTSQVCI